MAPRELAKQSRTRVECAVALGALLDEHPAWDSLLFESRLTPPVRRPGTVPRAGLVNRLRVSRAASLVLVTAPAGYGKTTLVAEWARRDGRPFAWCSMDEADDPPAFAAHLRAAIARALPRDSRPSLSHGPDKADETLALVARELASCGSPLVVVLDDFELVHEDESLRLLAHLVDELPTGSQLTLVSRAEPRLPLARLRAGGKLVELGIDELRFSDREAAALLHNAGSELPRADVEALNAAVEGWPAGLYLAALSLRSSSPRVGNRIRSGAGITLDYFRAELLAGLPDADVRFLTRTSVLDRLCGPLCDFVAEMTASAEVLERLARSNMFIAPIDRERRWYRMHGVFRKALAAELERREPGMARQLRSRAAAWCAEYGDPELALEYALGSGDRERLVELVGRSALPFTATARPKKVERWLGTLDDPELLERHPAVAAIGALTWAMIGRPVTAERWAYATERASAHASTPWQALLSAVMCPNGPDAMRVHAERALAALPLGSRWRAPALVVLGSAHALNGDTASAETFLREAADTAASVGTAAVESLALAYASLLATERGNWERADVLAAEAREIISAFHLEGEVTSLAAFAASARSALRRGDWKVVRGDLERATQLLPRLTYVLGSFSVFIRLELARVHLGLGDSEGTSRLLDEIDEIFDRRPHLGVFRTDASTLRAELEAYSRRSVGRTSTLTAAELRLLPLLATHLSFHEIADRLFVSRNTVKTQAISVYRKLGVSSRSEAIVRASSLGLVAERSDGEGR